MMKHKNRGLRTALAVAIASATLAGCGSDSKEAASTPAAAATVEAAGGMTVKLQGGIGGNGAGNYGGSGNDFELYKEAGGGDVKVLKTGAANAAFTAKSFTPSFGEVKATVSVDTAPSVLADCAATPPAADVLYQVANDSRLFKSNGATVACEAAEVVTGLDVKSGATLTLGLNWNGATWVYINLDADIRNNGKITTPDVSPTQRGNIDLEGSSYIGSGKIETNGTADGQSAGDIYVYGDYAMINSGKMNASGADSSTAAAGNAGYIDMESGYYTQNTGSLTARGGNTTFAGAAGGDADYIYLYSDWGPVFNSGAIDGRGGEGATGGDGADVYMYAYLGKLYNSGKMSVYGANSTVGNGGAGGYVGLEAYGGQLRNSGSVLAWGGDTTDVAGSGGSGNELYAYSEYGSLYEYTPAGSIFWSGQIDLSGGDAVATGTGNGGSAGDVYAEVYGGSETLKANLEFLGYSKVQTYGGEGNHGGSAGGYELYNYDDEVDGSPEDAYAFAGNVVSQAAVVGYGGNARATGIDAQGNGGRGGYIYLETDYYPTAQLVPNSQKTTHNGNVNIAGGTGRNQNSIYINYGGGSWIWGYNGASFTGTFNSDGGDDLGTTAGAVGFGGYAPGLYVYSELGVAKVAGNVSSNGGDGNYAGGYSDGMYIYGNTVNVASTIKANGGNADPLEAGSQGGNGGYIELKATRPENSTVTGSATYAGGTGATKGNEGGYMRLISCAGAGC